MAQIVPESMVTDPIVQTPRRTARSLRTPWGFQPLEGVDPGDSDKVDAGAARRIK